MKGLEYPISGERLRGWGCWTCRGVWGISLMHRNTCCSTKALLVEVDQVG